MIAIMNVSGERTTGSRPYYGVVISTHATYAEAEAAVEDGRARNRHEREIAEIGNDAVVGARVRYVRASEA